MRRVVLLLLLVFIQFSFSQSVCEEGDRAKSGYFILSNGDKLNFNELECQKNKVRFFNKLSNEEEFLYKASIKEIIFNEKGGGSFVSKPLGEVASKEKYKTFIYKGQEVMVPLPSKEKAVVYFVRTNASGFAINFRYFDTDKFIGKFAARGYLKYECEPGEHIFWVASENKQFVKADLESGKIYMIEVVPSMGITHAQVVLNVPDTMQGRKYDKMKQRILKIFTKKEWDKTPTEADLQKEISHKDEIEIGLGRYEKKLKKGKVKFIKPGQDFK